MKKIFSLAILATLIGFAASCDKAELLEPTNIEKNWAENIDLSNSYVKQLYEQTGVAILTEYNDTLDVFYQGSDYGVVSNVKISHVEAKNRDNAIEWLKTNILDCFSTECIKNYFPRRIFLCNTISADGEPGYVGTWLRELKYSKNCWGAAGAQHAFPFAQGIAICVNVDELLNPNTAIDYATEYRIDIMTLLCHELFMNNDWLEGVKNNQEVFPDKVTSMYGLNPYDKETTNAIDTKKKDVVEKGMYRILFGCNVKDPKNGDPIAMWDWRRMTLENYFKFGFPDNGQNGNARSGSYFKWPTGTPSTWTSTYYDDGSGNTYASKAHSCSFDGYAEFSNYSLSQKYLQAPRGQYRDSRDMIFAIIDVNDVKLSVYGSLLISRLCAMSDYLKSMGIDFKKFNPSVSKMYEMN